MGNVLTDQCTNRSHFQSVNEVVSEHDDYHLNGFKEVHALVVYVDYGFEPAHSAGWCPPGFGAKLDTSENAAMIKGILSDAGVASITEIYNLHATKDNVLRAVQMVGAQCDEDDVFFFFYSGHGAPLPDQDGDEEDGNDEAMCLPYPDGRCDPGSWLRDDDFSAAVAAAHGGTKVIVLDCCHSGSMLDFKKKFAWHGQTAVSLCGCRDAQEAAAMGGGSRGGAFSKCLVQATRVLGNEEYSVGRLFNTVLSFKHQFVPAAHQQDMTISTPEGLDPSMIPWPLTMPNKDGQVRKARTKRNG
eukprot:gnl/TRDRNA2_/TRDRNA2_174730_c1_seq5.p1 gnl/TRDRNA2_/TRDRNA2_174730_c1~~gnl/TRDRNA2_/TRDRNA2_174730_c1_seq5.p1  ORF type:complete len:300 (-),score=58.66 gnl/TRDRNA2_/TRDRNA2_174730_c1_seq5:75-974(-)